jgi:hypothetical protein
MSFLDLFSTRDWNLPVVFSVRCGTCSVFPIRGPRAGSFPKTGSGRQLVKGGEVIIDDDGQKKAVLINLKKHGEIWEDFYDTLRVKERESEPRESLEEVKKKVLDRP